MTEDCATGASSYISDEERVRRLFQVCDANGDGFIDSQDLLVVCRELSLEDSLDELMLQLGADSQGRISYEQFLTRRLALKPEINALKLVSNDNSSDNIQGKVDSWDWDSGARDMSLESKSNTTKTNLSEEQFKGRLQQQLDEQAQRYEEQLTELHSVIAELTRKLHQQRNDAITEEDEISECCTSIREESATCPLEEEVGQLEQELHPKTSLPESQSELLAPKLMPSNYENLDIHSYNNIVEPLKREIISLKQQLDEAHTRLAKLSLSCVEAAGNEEFVIHSKYNLENSKESENHNDNSMLNVSNFKQENNKNSELLEGHIELNSECHQDKQNIKYSSIVPLHKNSKDTEFNMPIMKIAERIKLKTTADKSKNFLNTNLKTVVGVGDVLRQCENVQYDKQAIDFEIRRRLASKLEHAQSQNTVLALTLNETKAHCDRLTLLCGKYESNAIALRLALGITDRTIEAYDVLLALFETELSLNQDNIYTIQNRTAAETVAKQLLCHLTTNHSTDVLLSPWQNHIYSIPEELNEPWSKEHEIRLREHISRLKAERSKVQGTFVTLESPHYENIPLKLPNSQETRKMDLETAALMQELMSLREDKTELLAKLLVLEKDKHVLVQQLAYVEKQQNVQSAALKNLQDQLKDTEELLARLTQDKDSRYSDLEHVEHVELELMHALSREGRLKMRLHELVSSLEQVTLVPKQTKQDCLKEEKLFRN